MIGRLRFADFCPALAAILLGLALAFQGDAPARVATPLDNRLAIEAGCVPGGTHTLAAGVTTVDTSPKLSSRSTLQGDVKGSTLRSASSGPTLNIYAEGLGYTQTDHVNTPMQVGDWVYRFQFGAWWSAGKSNLLLCQVTRILPNGTYQTNPPPHPKHDAILRFKRAYPCGEPREGADSVTLTVAADGLSVGQLVFVTNGPADADAARGEHRRIVSIADRTVTLDRPLRQSYGPAVVAWIEPPENVTVRNLRVESLPNGNPVRWAAQFKGHVGLRLENVSFDGMTDLVTCGDAVVSGFSGPALQINTTVGARVERSRLGALYLEESASDITVTDCELGVGRHPDANIVTAWFHCSRVSLHRCRLIGAGRDQWPPPAAIHMQGKDMSVIDCEVVATRPNSWSYLGGEGLMVRGLRSDAPVQLMGSSKRASVHGVRSPYVELVGGTPADGNTIVDASKVVTAVGWQAVACQAWTANQPGATAPQAPKAEPKRAAKQ